MLSVIRFAILFLAISLQSCGGSSNGKEAKEEFKFVLNAKLYNKCGVATDFTDYELYLQDENWKTLSQYQANSHGQVSFVITKEFINYTIVAKTQRGDDKESYAITSFAKVATRSKPTFRAQYDKRMKNGSCQCNKQTLQLRHRPFTLREQVLSSAPFDSWLALDERTTEFAGVEVCREQSNPWPLHSFAVLGQDHQQQSIGAAEFVTDFSATSDKIWQVSAIEVLDSYQPITTSASNRTLSQFIAGNRHLTIAIAKDASGIELFKNHLYASEVSFSSTSKYTFPAINSEFGAAKFEHQHTVVSELVDEALMAAANETLAELDVTQLLTITDDKRYNYSAVANYPMAIVELVLSNSADENSTDITWTFYGENKGVLPLAQSLAGYDNLIALKDVITINSVSLLKSDNNHGFQDYIDYVDNNDLSVLSNNLRRININVQ
ncbi:MAG: hypothetical protein ACSHW0_00250 [Thalassotalea sp.]